MIPRIAVVATHNRPAELTRLLAAITPQCNKVIIIDNASTPPVCYPGGRLWGVGMDDPGCPGTSLITRVEVIRDGEQPPNLSRLWNLGIDAARDYVRGGDYIGHDVAVLNDDAVPPPGWWDALTTEMRIGSAVAASSDPFGAFPPGYRQWYGPDAPMSVVTRLAGWAMLLRGEWEGARFDERLRWWTGDDDLSLRARQAGGIVHVGGFPVPNTGADSSTVGVLAEQAAKDMETFVQIHGRRPW